MRKPILHSCQSCGKEFQQKNACKPNKYCSTACYRLAQKSGVYIGTRAVKHPCENCGSMFVPQSGARFCSRNCYDDSRRKECLAKYSGTCACCGKSYTRNYYPTYGAGKFCSEACRIRYKKPKPISCINCGVEFSPIYAGNGRIVAVSSRKTCSDECLSEFYKKDPARKYKISVAMSGSSHPNWQGGSHRIGYRGAGWVKLAESIRDRDGRACKKCGMTEEESILKGWGRLQVNHKKPFHQFRNKTHANRPSNLEALCKSCHTITDWQWRSSNSVQMTLSFK